MKAVFYNVMIADDHLMIRDAIAAFIGNLKDCRITGLARNGRELLKAIDQSGTPDIVILDVNMPVMDGFETAHHLFYNYPQVKIIAMSNYDSEIALVRLLQFGIKSFITKDIETKMLRHALNSVIADECYYSNNSLGKLARLFVKSQITQLAVEKMYPNEKEIEFLKYVCTEMTYKQIAQKMDITPRCVDSYRDNLFSKLDRKTRVGLAMYAVKNGIITL